MDAELVCHCGKDGHPLGSINCPVHGTAAVRERADSLEQFILAALRRAHDEFAQNGFDTMAVTMNQAIHDTKDLAAIAQSSRRHHGDGNA